MSSAEAGQKLASCTKQPTRDCKVLERTEKGYSSILKMKKAEQLYC